MIAGIIVIGIRVVIGIHVDIVIGIGIDVVPIEIV